MHIEEVDTSAIDALKSKFSPTLGPKSVNNRLSLLKAVLRFMWKRGHLPSVPYVPMESVPERNPEWYSEEERDRLLVDRAVPRGNKSRPAMLGPRKNNKALTLALTEDVADAISWHIRQGYSGAEFLFSKDGTFPVRINAHERPLRAVQRALGLRELSHHKVGRHSVASQAATSGHSIKAIQAQLGHQSEHSNNQYAHLGERAQLLLAADLGPSAPPHVNVRSTSEGC